jgi:hypothetical protein
MELYIYTGAFLVSIDLLVLIFNISSNKEVIIKDNKMELIMSAEEYDRLYKLERTRISQEFGLYFYNPININQTLVKYEFSLICKDDRIPQHT